MATQRERTIQRRALEFLEQWYRDRHPGSNVAHLSEAAVHRSRKYHGRADGLIAVAHADGRIRTAAVEAKSHRTRLAIRGKMGCGVAFLVVAVPFLSALVAACLYLGGTYGLLARLTLGSLAGTACALGLLWLVYDKTPLNPRPVLAQLLRYPAGEHWLALPADMERDHGPDVDALHKICRSKGLGLIVVPRKNDPRIVVEPTPRVTDMLVHYKRGEQLRAKIARAAR